MGLVPQKPINRFAHWVGVTAQPLSRFLEIKFSKTFSLTNIAYWANYRIIDKMGEWGNGLKWEGWLLFAY